MDKTTRQLLTFLQQNSGDILDEDSDEPAWVRIRPWADGPGVLQVLVEDEDDQVLETYRLQLTRVQP